MKEFEQVYKIGRLLNPLPSDLERYVFSEAYGLAFEMATDPNDPIAIWDQDDEVVKLFLNGDEFRPDN